MSGYLAMVRIGAKLLLQYRVMVFVMVGLSLVQVLVLTRVWHAVYSGRAEVGGLPLRETIVYLTLTNLQAGLLMPSSVDFLIGLRIRTGHVVFDVSRPYGYVGQMVAMSGGRQLAVLAFMLLGAPLGFWIGGISAPHSAGAAVAYAVALAVAWAIYAQVSVLVGLSAFWLTEAQGMGVIAHLVGTFLAGTAVPLVFFPGWLRAVAHASPFPFLGYVPASIYLGRISGPAVLGNLVLGAVWVAVLAGILALAWRRTFSRVVSQGG
ncbi:ABC-2 type transport system permease protein [Motilibacter rhizosphaerae]|uniref:ABC-2 type transport system permease protein n=1 Tax=Motilibacter rhizosphaerae TaxID=598652 RepID=A0A4Q7NUY6_9ACTN|nr:ABC-2 family transporter protein [Motilibacter rhizosphaerae]RZS91033.1 ABC-2 type transport system permease protein [Motilibacter rhizosphaerae]